MAKLDPAALVDAASDLSREDGCLSNLVSALSCAGTLEARQSLARIARESYLVGGHEALEALRDLGDHTLLLEIAQSDLPAPYREIALSFLGENFAELCLEELCAIASRSPEPSLRKLALRFLSTHDRPEALGALGPALDDPELKGEALEWLSRTAPDSVADLLLELLAHPDFAVRSRAARLLASATGPEIPPRLLLHLLSARREPREAALAALRLRGDISRWAGELPSLLTSPGALLLEKARELSAASRAALRGWKALPDRS
jgi:HEAT repeat protein